ncbi:MAG: phosphoribosylaminoimidazolesuccinocarboxamide synthase [Bacillota bacterium]
MDKKEMLYEGKAKKVYITDDPDVLRIEYKDDATAFNGLKKGSIANKGVVNNKMSNHIFRLLEKQGIPTHYVQELSERETDVKKVEIVPVEVIIRNIAAGSFTKRLGVEEGRELPVTVLEFCYKNDELGDPLINDYHIAALELATADEMKTISDMAFVINKELQKIFAAAGLILVDFKLEFGRYKGSIILADEISPDTCRLWDSATRKKLDKDRFRRDLGDVEEAYQEVYVRLGI